MQKHIFMVCLLMSSFDMKASEVLKCEVPKSEVSKSDTKNVIKDKDTVFTQLTKASVGRGITAMNIPAVLGPLALVKSIVPWAVTRFVPAKVAALVPVMVSSKMSVAASITATTVVPWLTPVVAVKFAGTAIAACALYDARNKWADAKKEWIETYNQKISASGKKIDDASELEPLQKCEVGYRLFKHAFYNNIHSFAPLGWIGLSAFVLMAKK
jgi:hypothetical protein